MSVHSLTPRWAVGRFLPVVAALSATLLAGCATRMPEPVPSPADAAATPLPPTAKSPSSTLPALPRAGSGKGGYYLDDGPGDAPPEGLLDTPDAEPKIEPYSTRGNKPYVVFGKTYAPFTDDRPFRQSGIGSWYGRKFHGQKTSSGELYDMYKMTAAHPTLPIPSYARVTNQNNGRQVIVRVNDRGPFLHNRIIDLSYTAALKLGYLEKGSGMLLVERLLPDEIARMDGERRLRQAGTPTPATVALPVEVTAMEVSLPTVQSAELTTGSAQGAANMASAVGPVPVSPAAAPVPVQPSASAAGAAPSSSAATGPASSLLSLPASQTTRGIYLQFGAYSRETNALSARSKLLQDLAGLVPSLSAVVIDGLHRLHAGPYADRTAAQEAVRLVEQKIRIKPLIVER